MFPCGDTWDISPYGAREQITAICGVLDQKRILVVEDEYELAEELRLKLERAGAVVLGPVSDVESALSVIAAIPALDAALLDINLNGTMVFPVADALIARSVPFVFTFGYDNSVFEQHYALMPRCQKPTPFSSVLRELAALFPEEISQRAL